MFKKILSLITLALVAFVVWGAWDQITAATSCIFGGHCIEGGEFSINLINKLSFNASSISLQFVDVCRAYPSAIIFSRAEAIQELLQLYFSEL